MATYTATRREANRVISALTRAETRAGIAPDMQRVLRDERMRLMATVQTEYGGNKTEQREVFSVRFGAQIQNVKMPPDEENVRATIAEAKRTAGLWGVEIE